MAIPKTETPNATPVPARPGIAPIAPRGEPVHPGGRNAPRTFQDVQAERERYRQWLRDHGMIDPATQSIPGDGGGYTGGPMR